MGAIPRKRASLSRQFSGIAAIFKWASECSDFYTMTAPPATSKMIPVTQEAWLDTR